MNSLLLWIGGLLVAVLGLLFAVPHLVDWNAYRGVFEEEATRILGRDVRVGGKVNLRLLPSPYVRFEKVRISDAGAALGEPFFRAEAFTLWLSPTPLLRGAIEANEIELDQPVLRLAVDAGGNGNWQQLRITPGALPFMPSDIVLQQVRIHKGVVSLRTPSAAEPLTLSGIEGELAASSLDGPYRFRGNVDWAGVPRELRINTAQREPNGQLRYKASVRALDSGNVYSLDGVLSELSARARHTGVLTAKLPLGSFGADAGSRSRSARAGDIFDLKANIAGDLDGLRLTDLQLAFEQDGKPQLMTGEATANWRNGMRTETRLASRWIDLDLIIGQGAASGGAKPMPFNVLRRSIAQLSDLLPNDGSSVLAIDVDQLNLGGEPLRDVRLALARAGGVTSIGELRAVLPGNAKAEVRGTLGLESSTAADGAAAKPTPVASANASFDGELALHGASYRRLLAWATGAAAPGTGDMAAVGVPGDSAFLLASRLRLQSDRVALNGASLEVGNRLHSGALDWSWGRERGLALAIEGQLVDVGALVPGVLDLTSPPPGSAVRTATDSGSAVLAAIASRATAIERDVGNLHFKVRAHALTDGTTTLNDVDADLTLRGQRLEIASLKLATTTAARVDLQGAVSAIGTQPQGLLRGWIGAAAGQGVTSLLGLLPAGAYQLAEPWLGRSGSADIGFSLTLGGTQPGRAALRANGAIDETRIALDLTLDGGLGGWRDAPISVALSLDGARATGLARLMAGWRGETAGHEPARLRVNASGANATGLMALASLETSGQQGKAKADFNGRATIDAGSGAVALSGILQLDAAEAGDLVLAAGAPRRPYLPGTPVSGLLAIERKGGTTSLSTTALDIGRSRVAGQITLAERPGRMRIDGKLTASRIGLLSVAGLILDGGARTAADAGGDDTPSPWPDAPLTLGLLERLEGQLTLSAPVAVLAEGLELADAGLDIGLSPGRLTIASLTGATLGGRLTARSSLEAQTAGVNMSVDLRMTGVQLGLLGGGAARRNLGDANLTLALAGRASSLRAATAQLAGRGEIELRNARAEGLGAEMIERIAQAAIEATDAGGGSGLQTLIAQERSRSTALIGNRKLPIEVADGIARIGVLDIATPAANLRNTTTIDVASLKADSEWRIAPRRPLPGQQRGSRREPLPSMALVWTGPLSTIARGEPKLSTDALEREISIRRIENETEKLEELRRQDEQRAAVEAEKLKRNEEVERGPSQQPAGTSPPESSAPVIQAPLPIPQGQGEAQRPPPVTRPPPRAPRAEGSKALLDALMGQQ